VIGMAQPPVRSRPPSRNNVADLNTRLCLLATVLALVAIGLAGCGGSEPSPAESHLAAVAKAACINAEGMGSHADIGKQLARFRALIHSDRKLPRVATLISDVAARRRVRTAMHKLSGNGSSRAYFGHGASTILRLMKQSYVLAVKVYTDEKALGIACLGSPPRKPIEG
jgi:hypothetical protein